MASALGKPAYSAPLVLPSGVVSPTWLRWFNELFAAGQALQAAQSALASLQATLATDTANIKALQTAMLAAQSAIAASAAALALVQTTLTSLGNTVAQHTQQIAALSAGVAALPSALYFNVKDYAATGNGAADDSAAILAAVNAANAAGGGCVFFPAGTYSTGTIPLYSFVSFEGAAEESSILKLKPGTNADLFQGTIAGYTNGVNGYTGTTALVNLAAPAGTGSNTGITGFAIRNLTLDGNVSNQTGYGAGLRLYGYGYRLANLYIRNFYGDGIYADWNPNTSSFSLSPNQLESQWLNLKIHDIGYSLASSVSMGIRLAGGTDNQLSNIIIYKTGSHGMQIGPNAQAAQCTSLHVWGVANGNNAAGILCEANGCMFVNCEVEGSDVCEVALICAQVNWYGGKVFGGGTPGTAYTGFQLGQLAGDLPFVGSANQTTPGSLANPPTAAAGTIYTCSASIIETYLENTYGGALNPRSENSNIINVVCNQTGTTAMRVSPVSAATLNTNDAFSVRVKGITSDGSFGTAGGFQTGNSGNPAFAIYDASGHALFLINGAGRPFGAGLFTVPGSDINGYVDWFFATKTYQITHTGFFQSLASGFAVGSNVAATVATASIPAPWQLGAGATVVVYNSAAAPPYSPNPQTPYSYGKVRVNAASAVTGLILQAGSIDGTEVTLCNESAYPLTFAATGSNVALASWQIPAGSARKVMWNGYTALWYPEAALATTGGGYTVQPQRTITASTTALATDAMLFANAASGAITVTLPATPSTNQIVEVKKIDSSANAVTLTPATGTLDGAASVSWSLSLLALEVQFDGANWWII
jgi:hypothetical protein